MTANDLSHNSMSELHELIKDSQSQPNLQTIILSKNNIQDQGLRDIANGLLERFI